MRKNLLFSSIFLLCTAFLIQPTTTFASGGNAPFSKGTKVLGISAGLGIDYDYYGGYYQTPAIAVTYDQGIIDNVGPGTIGLGGIVGMKLAQYNYGNGYKANWANYIVAARGTYHLTLLKNKIPKLDPYGGVTAGLRITEYKDTYYEHFGGNPHSYNSAYPVLGLFVGAGYKFNNHFGAFTELGYDISFWRIGLNMRF